MPQTAHQMPDLGADSRSATRYRLLLPASGEAPASDLAPITIRDLSETGMLFEVGAGFPEAAGVVLDVPGVGAVSADIVWASGRLRGAQFVRPLSAADVRAAWTQSKVVWPQFRSDVSSPGELGSTRSAGVNTFPVARRIQIIVALATALWIGIAVALAHALG